MYTNELNLATCHSLSASGSSCSCTKVSESCFLALATSKITLYIVFLTGEPYTAATSVAGTYDHFQELS